MAMAGFIQRLLGILTPRGHHGHHDLLDNLLTILHRLDFHFTLSTLSLDDLGLLHIHSKLKSTPRPKDLCPDLFDSCTHIRTLNTLIV